MKYNNNIILNMISSEFFSQVEEAALEFVWHLEAADLWDIFEEGADYAELDHIYSLRVPAYQSEHQEEAEYISGILEVSAFIKGYKNWEEENIPAGSKMCVFNMKFGFYASQNHYFDFFSEPVY